MTLRIYIAQLLILLGQLSLGLPIAGIAMGQNSGHTNESILYPTTGAPSLILEPGIALPTPKTMPDNTSGNYYQKTNSKPFLIPSDIEPYPDLEVSTDELLPEVSASEEPAWYTYPVYWMGINQWDTGIELGVNGSTGSSESTSIRTGGYIKRESEFAKINIDAYYNKTSANGTETQNNAQLNIRNDWYLDKSSPWTLFSTGTAFYDQFQAYDLQVNANLGVGYKLIGEKTTNITLRVGAGASQEIGGVGLSEEWIPEALFGLDLDHQITKTQKLYAKIDYMPELEGFEEFRMVTDVGWEIELIRPSNVSLKLSMTDRYDSTPNGTEPQLLNYSVLLLWKM